MAFIRRRGGSHTLIETYREGDQVKQRIIANLGRYSSVAEAVAAEPQRFRYLLPSSDDTEDDDTTSVVSKAQESEPPRKERSPRVYEPGGLSRTREKEVLDTMQRYGIDRRAAIDRILDAQDRHNRAQIARGRPKRAELLSALAPLVPLSALISSPQRRAAIEEAFRTSDGADEMPRGLDPAALTRAVKLLMEWLPEVYDLLGARRPGGKRQSRAERWTAAKQEALDGLQELVDIKAEMASWRENIPENFGETAVVEKLDAFGEIDLDEAIAALEAIEDSPDFPRGFGRD